MWSRFAVFLVVALVSTAAMVNVAWPAALLTERRLALVSLDVVPDEDYREVSPGIVGK